MSEQAKGLTPNLAVSRVPARMPGWVEGASGAGSGGELLIPPYSAVTGKKETNEVNIQLQKLEKTESS